MWWKISNLKQAKNKERGSVNKQESNMCYRYGEQLEVLLTIDKVTTS